MERIVILGPCGAGKTVLARRLGERLNLPVIHLDREYWLPGWREPPPEARVIRRLLRHFGRSRPDMAEGCPERVDLAFWRYAWRYRLDVQPRRAKVLAASGVPAIQLSSPRATEAWLAAGAPLESRP